MCSGGDFFHEHVGKATGLALDQSDMFDIYGGPQKLSGPPEEFCNENLRHLSVQQILNQLIFFQVGNM